MKIASINRIMWLLLTLIISTIGANAAITQFGDSSTFDYRYDMDAQPNNVDLDSNGGDDWWDANIPAVSGGLVTFVNSGNNAQIFRGDFNAGSGGSIWREVANTAAADWTLEISARKDGGTQGADGWFGIATANNGESNSSRINIHDDRISTSSSQYLVGSDFTSDFVTIRIAHDAADNEFYYWVNGTLLNVDLSTPIAGVNGTNFNNSIFIGDFSGSLAGNFSIDYIRLDTDAIGVIPEPSAIMFGSISLVSLLRRRR